MTSSSTNYAWTDELVAIAQRHVANRVPYSRIAELMPADGRGQRPTRNAVMGKMDRAHTKTGHPTASAPFIWTEERVAILRSMAPTSGRQHIAARLGTDGRVVYDKARQLKIELHGPGRGSREIVRRPASKPTAAKHSPAKPPDAGPAGLKCKPLLRATPIGAEPLRISIMELRGDTCRWPLGAPGEPEFCYCGRPAPLERPYCREHEAIATLPTRRSGMARREAAGS